MEPTTKIIIWLAATLLTGLSAGFFYAWQVSVIPGTKLIHARNYIETMQAVNRAIINPAFMLIFFGPLLFQVITLFLFRGTPFMTYLLAACLCYFLGTLIVTALGNVPLNNVLDGLNSHNMSQEQLDQSRLQYALKWNRFHLLRTVFSVLSFILMLLPALIQVQYSIQHPH